jgi:hypothetical protein
MRISQAVSAVRSLAMVVGLCALTALAGCGDPTKGTAVGKVTYKGAPVTGGSMSLKPAAGSAPGVMIVITADGSFNMPDIPVGQYKVTVETDSVANAGGAPIGVTPPKDAPKLPDLDTSKLPKKVAIPPKYKDAASSGLTWEIKPGTNRRDIDLTD